MNAGRFVLEASSVIFDLGEKLSVFYVITITPTDGFGQGVRCQGKAEDVKRFVETRTSASVKPYGGGGLNGIEANEVINGIPFTFLGV